MYRIKIDRSRCIGCLTCVTACVVSHESNDARNRVVIDSEGKCAPFSAATATGRSACTPA